MVVLVLFLLILSASSVVGQTTGCYIYPKGSEDLYCQSGVSDTEAQADCGEHPDCSMQQHFVPGSNCAEFSVCEEITCSVDCQLHARGVCEQLGGSEVPANEFAYRCSPGCCKVADKFCQFNLNKFQCEDKAKKLGFQTYDAFDNSVGMSTAKCNQLYCGVVVSKVGLSGAVKDQEGNLLAGVDVSLEGTGLKVTTSSSGAYSFPPLNPGTYLVKVTATGYLPLSLSMTFLPGEQAAKEIVLTKAVGLGTVQGQVRDENNNLIASATIAWSGPASGQVLANANGE